MQDALLRSTVVWALLFLLSGVGAEDKLVCVSHDNCPEGEFCYSASCDSMEGWDYPCSACVRCDTCQCNSDSLTGQCPQARYPTPTPPATISRLRPLRACSRHPTNQGMLTSLTPALSLPTEVAHPLSVQAHLPQMRGHAQQGGRTPLRDLLLSRRSRAVFLKPYTLIAKRETLNPKPATLNSTPSTLNSKP